MQRLYSLGLHEGTGQVNICLVLCSFNETLLKLRTRYNIAVKCHHDRTNENKCAYEDITPSQLSCPGIRNTAALLSATFLFSVPANNIFVPPPPYAPRNAIFIHVFFSETRKKYASDFILRCRRKLSIYFFLQFLWTYEK